VAESVAVPALSHRESSVEIGGATHAPLVRVTHWITAVAFVALVVSGIAILLAHPRLYWGETGALGTPSLIDLPLPMMLTGQSGWGRSLHFLSAWLSVLTGVLYVIFGLVTSHFRTDLVPRRSDLTWRSISHAIRTDIARPALNDPTTYNSVQRLTYLLVVFLLFPAMIWTGLAMSPAITSVFPALVDIAGGQQSARTIHFFVAVALLLFFVLHVVMVWRAGFIRRVGAMITGRRRAARVDAV